MHDYSWGGNGWGGYMLFHGLFWLILLVIIAVGAVAVARSRPGNEVSRSKSALDLLNERYARGEIDREEYLQLKKDIQER